MAFLKGNGVRALLSSKDLLLRDLARAAEIAAPSVSAILNSIEPIGPKRRKRLANGLRELGFSSAEIDAALATPKTS